MNFYYRNFRFRRQIAPDRINLGADIGQCLIGIIIQFQPDGDLRLALLTLRLDVIDAIRRSDRALERRCDKAANQFRVCADVNRGDGNRRDIATRILPNIQTAETGELREKDR